MNFAKFLDYPHNFLSKIYIDIDNYFIGEATTLTEVRIRTISELIYNLDCIGIPLEVQRCTTMNDWRMVGKYEVNGRHMAVDYRSAGSCPPYSYLKYIHIYVRV